MPPTPHVSFRLSPQGRALLDSLSKRQGWTKTATVEWLLRAAEKLGLGDATRKARAR